MTEAPVPLVRPTVAGRARAIGARARSWLRPRDRALPVAPTLLLPPILFVLTVAVAFGAVATAFIRAELDSATRARRHRT